MPRVHPALDLQESLLAELVAIRGAINRYDFVAIERALRGWESIRERSQKLGASTAGPNAARLLESLAQTQAALTHWRHGTATLLAFGPTWVSQTLQNIPQLATMSPLDALSGLYAKRPAVVVSAGPSLEANIKDLRLVRGRSVIIAVSRVLAALRSEDIEPDFVIVGDSQDLSPHLPSPDGGQPVRHLVVRPSCHPRIVASPALQRIAYGTTIPHEAWLFETMRRFSPLEAAGSVAHAAFDLGLKLGCDPIVLVGQDLALKRGAYYSPLTHSAIDSPLDHFRESADGSSFLWGAAPGAPDSTRCREEKLIDVPGYDGGNVKTTASLHQFLVGFERMVASAGGTTVINATEGGARIRGTAQVKLRFAARALFSVSFDAATVTEGALVTTLKLELPKALESLHKDLIRGIRVTRNLLAHRSAHPAGISHPPRLLADLHRVTPACLSWAISSNPELLFDAYREMASDRRTEARPDPYYRALHDACVTLEPRIAGAARRLR